MKIIRRDQEGISQEAGLSPSEHMMGLQPGQSLGNCGADRRVREERQREGEIHAN